MAHWSNCNIVFAHYDNKPVDEVDGEVIIDEKKIIVSWYDDEIGNVIYRGKNNRNGHFFLTSANPSGEGYLHQFPQTNILSGYMIEEGYDYFLKIDLK